MKTDPQNEHLWLHQLVGEWTMESEYDMGPGQAKGRSTGKETVRKLGELWIICEGEGEMPGGDTGYMRMTLGFDPAKGRYVGSWVGSMMTHMWVYEGTVEDGKTLPLNCEGTDFSPGATPGATAKYQDVITIVGPDERTLTSRMKGPDGQWVQFMKATYRRAR